MSPKVLVLARSWLLALCCPVFAAAVEPPVAASSYQGWKHSGALTLLTTPEGANLPATASVADFPVLVRLNTFWFDFSQAKAAGDDLRFSDASSKPLVYQIEDWDAVAGVANVWVRVPQIKGNDRQAIRLHWGKADAVSESNGAAVFNEANGYVSVWHLNGPVTDAVGILSAKDNGTTDATGMIGKARHLAGGQGIFGGEKIDHFPLEAEPHSSEAWVRATVTNGNILGWGNEKAQGKVVMQFASPPHIRVDAYFSGGNASSRSTLPMAQWVHVVHTYRDGRAHLYVNGVLDSDVSKGGAMAIKKPARLWIGGWYNNYNFVGDIDEVRVSKVERSAEWIKLQYENQKSLQTLVGTLPQSGTAWSVSTAKLTVAEGKTATVTGQAGGALKVFWTLKAKGQESVVATDRFTYTVDAGRVTGNQEAVLTFTAIHPDTIKTKDIALTITEDIPDPVFTLKAPATWDGRSPIEVMPQVTNLSALQAKNAGEVKTEWSIADIAVTKETTPEKLLLTRAHKSGALRVSATISNGGQAITQTATIAVTEPKQDVWVARMPGADEKPEEGQFYARDDRNAGTLHYNGTLNDAADAVFISVYADDKPYKTETAKPAADKSYRLAVRLKPGLIKYKVEFGTTVGGKNTVLQTVNDLVCGDAYLIDGQSNALATDTGEKSPAETNEWIRSYGRPAENKSGPQGNLWCLPVWKAQKGEKAELGWWGMELAKRLVDSQKVPIFIINAAVGGTRVDQHQRSATNPTDLSTIYGRMLWRVQQAKMTHGIRGVLWHQGESDQGSDGPTGGYGWQSYQQLFIDMATAWKQDMPNIRQQYIFQIWPNSCAMGGSQGNGDRLRERQRTLPQYFSNMSIMSTLGVRPPGGCHFPLIGWAEFARTIQPLMERDFYGKAPTASITPPNLQRASVAGTSISLEFDQPVIWTDALASQFYLDGQKDKIAGGSVSGNVLTLILRAASTATQITYLKEVSWNQDNLLLGANGIAALTFCDVPIESSVKR